MEKILKDLENLQKSFKLYTLIIVSSLILIISYPSYNIIIYLTEKQYYLEILFFIVIALLTILIISISILNSIWEKDAKKLIFQSLPSLIENLNDNTRITIKYSPTKKHSKNINHDLLKFINEMLLLNGINKSKAISYLSNGFSRNVLIRLEDELIIEIQEPELEKLNFEAIEVFLEDEYSKSQGYGKRRRTITYTIENFRGIILSTKLINPDKLNNQEINFLKVDNKKDTPILIYNKILFTNPTNISFFKNKPVQFSISIFNYVFNTTQLINHKELDYQINNIGNDTYIFYPKNQDITYLSKIALKTSEKLYISNKFYKSFGVIFNNTIYLFLNHQDNIFNSMNLFSIPGYLFSKTNDLENTIQNFKTQLETLLKLIV
jgi:hypothetical protein